MSGGEAWEEPTESVTNFHRKLIRQDRANGGTINFDGAQTGWQPRADEEVPPTNAAAGVAISVLGDEPGLVETWAAD